MKFWLFILLFFPALIYAQQNAESDTTGTGKIIVYNSDYTVLEKKDGGMIKYLYGNVKVYHDSTYFFADTAILNDLENYLFAYGNVTVLQHDTIKMFCDTLFYKGDSMNAELRGKVLLVNGNKKLKTERLYYDLDKKIAYYNDKALLVQDKSKLKSLAGIYYINDNLVKFKHKVSVEDSAFVLHTDSLLFHTTDKKAVFIAPVVIIKDSTVIYSEGGFYDMKNNNALFEKNPFYKKGDAIAKAEKMYYIDSLNQYLLVQNAEYKDDEIFAKADTIIHKIKDKISILSGNAYLKTKDKTVRSQKIIYHHDDKSIILEGNGFVDDNGKIISAVYMDYSDKSGKGHVRGNVFYHDTISRIIIKGYEMKIDEKEDFMTCYGDSTEKLTIVFYENNDSTYITGDTLLSERKIIDGDTLKYFKIFHNVKIYNKDYQSIADSLVYNSRDSVYILYKNPVLWSDSTQITGDTIDIYMKDNSIDYIYARNNAMIVSMVAPELFNQIKGNRIKAYFVKDSLDRMQVNGNSEVIYFMQDDNKALLGTIKTQCSKIDFTFKNNKIKDIKFYGDPQSTLIPIKKEILNPHRLQGFKWLDDKRPKDKSFIYK